MLFIISLLIDEMHLANAYISLWMKLVLFYEWFTDLFAYYSCSFGSDVSDWLRTLLSKYVNPADGANKPEQYSSLYSLSEE